MKITYVSRRRLSAVTMAAAYMLSAPAAFADVVGIGEGIVRDPTGAVVAGAKITLTRVSTTPE